MKLPIDGDWILAGVICGVLTVGGGGWATPVHAQSPEVPVQEVEELGALEKILLTLQMVVASAVRDQIGPLYAYDPTASAINGLEVRPETIGSVATVSRCSGHPGRTTGWCARYFDHMDNHEALLTAYQTAYRAVAADRSSEAENDSAVNQSDDPTTYFATTYPLPNVEPARRFVSGLP